MAKHLPIAAALAAAAWLLLWQRGASRPDNAPPPAAASVPARAIPAATPAPARRRSTPDCTAPTRALVPQTALRESKMRGEAVDALFVTGYTQPEYLLPRLGKADDVAALAAFKVIRNCFRRQAPSAQGPTDPQASVQPLFPDCPAMPAWLAHDPRAVLKAAAERGSPDAMLEYALDALADGMQYARDSNEANLRAARELLRESEAYGRQAAEHGLLDAYIFMSRAYETGQFGTRDLESAYAYALPLAGHPEYGPYEDHLAELARRMTPAQLDSARTRAYGCTPAGAGDALRNPFG